jgi:hypothetical protein
LVIEEKGGSTGWNKLDLQLSFGNTEFSWELTGYDSDKRAATVLVTIKDSFDFNKAARGERSSYAEKLTTIGRSAELSSFNITVQYEITVRVVHQDIN